MFYFDSTIFLLIPAIILAFYAQFKVKSSYGKFSQVPNRRGITGYETARRILDANGLQHIQIERVSGELTDHYDPRTGVVRLSGGIYGGRSVASVSVAAHEIGHAIQHATGYNALIVRNRLVPVANIASNLAWPLAIIGILMGSLAGSRIFDLAIILYAVAVLFQLITLPVELNASRRALQQLDKLGIVTEEGELRQSKKMLSAAALTYVAAAAVAVANLLRLFFLRNND